MSFDIFGKNESVLSLFAIKESFKVATVSSHTDAIHIGAMEIDGSRMTLPR